MKEIALDREEAIRITQDGFSITGTAVLSCRMLPGPFTVGIFTPAAPDLCGAGREVPHAEVLAALKPMAGKVCCPR